jgi:DNA-binding response OmpR family regulator
MITLSLAEERMYRILIAEDEPRIAAFMEKGLQQSGFATEVVSSGDDALDSMANQAFDLLLLDLGLPGKTGQDVLAQLERQGSQLPTIVVTAQAMDSEDGSINQSFVRAIVSKPFRMRDLVQKVRSLLPAP